MSAVSQVIVVTEPIKVNARLRQLGQELTEQRLRSALENGISSSAHCTENHPPNYGGMTLWAESVRRLREDLIPDGWHRDNSYGFPTIVSPDWAIAIAVARGDENTGNPDPNACPSTQHKRGSVMRRAVDVNGMLPYDHLPPSQAPSESGDGTVATWVLLHYRKGEQLLYELSHPIAINSSGFVEAWSERIILTPITLDPTRMPVLEDEPVNPDVNIRRRVESA
jgi:hypothetical protein